MLSIDLTGTVFVNSEPLNVNPISISLPVDFSRFKSDLPNLAKAINFLKTHGNTLLKLVMLC